MNDRVRALRQRSLDAVPRISAERAQLLTDFYRLNESRYPAPLLRALSFKHLCVNKKIYIGPDELIVGERGPAPKEVSTYPELTCHSAEDLQILRSREKTSYLVDDETIGIYEREIIPFWQGRSLRDRIFSELSDQWQAAYTAGVFTEFMEQRAPGHTVADDKIYRIGLAGLRQRIADELRGIEEREDSSTEEKRVQLQAMSVAADAITILAKRHSRLALDLAAQTTDETRRAELLQIAEVCDRVPEETPRTFHEALQIYWFCHLAVITELNGWDSFSPGHLDQHLATFYQRGLADGSLTRESAKELLSCLFIKFNNHPAPPKVGVTAAESGTYTDFANINLGGLTADGADGSNEVTFILLEVIDELHLLQPSQNVQISQYSSDRFLKEACRVIRNGYGFPSVFNADGVIQQLLRQGKTIADARAGGTSGCVETGAFGKEAYILTGYFNLTKLLELALNNGHDPRTGTQLGPATGEADSFTCFEDLFAAWESQLAHFIEIKIAGNEIIENLYLTRMPAPFLSLITDDCIALGLDYNAGGARYNTSYIQGVGVGSLTDSLAAINKHVYQDKTIALPELVHHLNRDFADAEPLRQLLRNKSPKWGNDDDNADDLMRRLFSAYFQAVEGRPNLRGGCYHINMLPTTCHIYFGQVTGATADGRHAAKPLSEGISPVQGADRRGPVQILLSAAKMDQVKTGGTLLNMKFTPEVLAGDSGLGRLADLIRTYFKLGGHHIQFNVISQSILRDAKRDPESHRGLIVRVAGYSDYFCDLAPALQDEIISRTAQKAY